MGFFILLFSILIYSTAVSAQMLESGKIFYGHEWIDDDKTYFKIKVAEDGIYRIDYKDLINAGFPSAELIGHQLLLINRGNQVPVFVSKTETLSSGDFIYFYGEKNRGEIDKYLYQNPDTQQLNPEYSLFTDQNVYYLSWNDQTDNLRFEELPNNLDPNNLPPQERFYQHEDKRVFSDFHFKPTHNERDFIRYSSYDEGEGYGSEIPHQSIIPFSLDNIYFQGTRPKVVARFAGTSSTHFIQTKINDLILNKYAHQGYGVNDFEFNFNFDHLSEQMEIEVIGVTGNKDRHSLACISLIYPRTFDFNDQSEFRFNLSASFIPRYVEVKNFDFGNTEPLLFDVQNDQFLSAKTEGEVVKFILPASNSARRLLLFNPQTQIKTVSDIERFHRFLDLQNIGDYLIISNSELYQDRQSVNWVKEYADYRSSEQGGNYRATVINVNELYDLFAYGIDGHSLAIKNFINYLIDQGTDVKAVFIIGKGLEYPLLRKKNEFSGRIKCFVPTFGSPRGDNLFTAKGFNIESTPKTKS